MSMRKREEIQKMPRRLAGFFIALSLFGAPPPNNALWPDKLGDLSRTSAQKVVVDNRDLWDEYGLEAAEKAEYARKGKTLSLTAYRLKDPTGALAIYQWLRPAGDKPSKATDVAVESPDTLMALLGNYVVQAKGPKPTEFQLKQLYFNLPRVDQSSLPVLREYVPAKGLIPNSERYVSGPVSLQKFEPRISPSLAAFSMGAEAQLARYRTPTGEMSLAVFAYPTPQIARMKLDDFLKVPGTVAKRTGHMVAVVLNPPTPDDAERLLAQIKY